MSNNTHHDFMKTESKHLAVVIAIGLTAYVNDHVYNVLVIKTAQVKDKNMSHIIIICKADVNIFVTFI